MFKLSPVVHINIESFLQNKKNLFSLVEKYGSPLNVTFPEHMTSNIKEFKQVYEKYDIDGEIYFAHKPNKSKVFPAYAKKQSIGIDVASLGELNNALQADFPKEKIEATGPKSTQFLFALIKNKTLINVDSILEIKRIIEIAKTLKTTASILVRISQFNKSTSFSKLERFGIPYSDLNMVKELLESNKSQITLKGFSFHFNHSKIEPRIDAIEKLTNHLLIFQQLGFDQCQTINIGGGFEINFLQSKLEWENYINFMKKTVLGDIKDRLSFNGNNYGFFNDNDTIKGTITIPDFYQEVAKGDYLEKILQSKLKSFENQSIGKFFSENFIKLAIEPGKSLLDQCGITIVKVLDIKKSGLENIIVTEMNFSNLNSDRYEMFTDPIVITKKHKTPEVFACFIVGNLCLESDTICNRKVFLTHTPEPEDLLVFANTAPYRMDFVESDTLLQKKATKLAFIDNQITDTYDNL